VQQADECAGGLEEEGVHEPMELVDGQFEQARWGGGQVLLGGGGHGEERVGEQGEGGPLVPGGPAADLVLVQSGQALGGVERLLDPLPLPGDPDQGP
jgi:hypothetical protein